MLSEREPSRETPAATTELWAGKACEMRREKRIIDIDHGETELDECYLTKFDQSCVKEIDEQLERN